MSGKWGFASVAGITILSSLWLLGCRPAEPAALERVTEPVCGELGTVQEGTVEETSRGYGYDYVIYLPPCYEADTEKKYPVLYLLPGRSSGPGSWFAAGANETADDMILSGDIPPFIIVGTEEISSDPLAETVYNDLIPHVENSYRVKPGRRNRSAAGGSLGSTVAYRLAFQYPDQFASVGMFGGGLISGEEPRVEMWLDAMTAENRPRVFLNTGERDPLMLERAEIMIEVLDEKKIEHSEVFTAGEHSYVYWISNFPTYFEWLAEDWE